MFIDKISINTFQEIEIKKVTVKGQTIARLRLNVLKKGIFVPTKIYFDLNQNMLTDFIHILRMIEYLDSSMKGTA